MMPRSRALATASLTAGWPWPRSDAPNDMLRSMYSLPSTSQMRPPAARSTRSGRPSEAWILAAAATPPGRWRCARSHRRSEAADSIDSITDIASRHDPFQPRRLHRRVFAFEYPRRQRGADAGCRRRQDVTVDDLDRLADDVREPAPNVRPDMLLVDGVRRAQGEVRTGQQRERASAVVHRDGKAEALGEGHDLSRLGDPTRPCRI